MYSGLVNPAWRPDDGVSRRCSSGRRKRNREAFPFGCARHRTLGVGCGVSHNSDLRSHRQAFDEPCHIARRWNGWTDTRTSLTGSPSACARRHRATAAGAGERYPSRPSDDPATQDYNVVGNHIIYGSGHFARNLALARSACSIPGTRDRSRLPLGSPGVRRPSGSAGGCAAQHVAVYPGFASVAYTDLPASCMQFALFFAFATWLDKPTTRSTVWLGIAAGFALLSKFTILLFFPAVAFGLILCKLLQRDATNLCPKSIAARGPQRPR